MYQPDETHIIDQLDDLVDIIGVPRPVLANKATPYVTPLVQEFIESSPYFLMATANARGECDCTPRGDPPGSVWFPDNRTFIFADRKGNRRIDSMKNLLENPHVGLLFLIPGTDETVRLNGRATISRDPALCERLSMQGRPAEVVIIVHIHEVYTHCARSILRAKLWEPETWPDTDMIPTLAAMMAEQANEPPPDESAGKRTEEYRTILY